MVEWCKKAKLAPPTLTRTLMATISAFVRTSKNKTKCKVRFRIRDGRDIQLFYTSNLEINPIHWDAKRQEIKSKVVYDTIERTEFNTNVAKWKTILLEVYTSLSDKENLSSESFCVEVDKYLHPEKFHLQKPGFFELCDEFLLKRKLSQVRQANFKSLFRVLRRFEIWRQTKEEGYVLDIDTVSLDDLYVIDNYMRNEHIIASTQPQIYMQVPDSRKPNPRGPNTISGMMKKLRTIFIWAVDNNKTTNNPFKKYTIEDCVYGTPFYISIEERNRVYRTNLTRHPKLSIQRDIFVFQCLIGCRIGDLYTLTKDNLIRGAIEYIPRKSKDGRPVTVRVPLNSAACEILDRYADYEGPSLLPLISEQKYNKAIKRIFLAAGLKRKVTILNPLTREPEQHPLWQVASSHMARRTFVGNLYKQVKDPNLVGALSGHKEGSKAFARYRDIDEEMKVELVNLLS